MRQSAAVLCHDNRSLETLGNTLEELGMGLTNCHSRRQALESVMNGECSTLIVDFDLAGAEEVIRMAALLPEPQRPALLAVASRAWQERAKCFSPAPNAFCINRSTPNSPGSRSRLPGNQSAPIADAPRDTR
jgi:hypothetical protein